MSSNHSTAKKRKKKKRKKASYNSIDTAYKTYKVLSDYLLH
jgi:hypothetical protein